jgi:threonine aldolase
MIDLRSDTVTQPTRNMLEKILSAQTGDAGRRNKEGRGEDETVNQLEDLAAEITGKEDAALFSSGTLANITAILTYCRPGDNVLVDEKQHILLIEKIVFDPNFGRLAPITYRLTQNGTPDRNDIAGLIDKKLIKLLCIENTHNFAGGRCIPLEEMKVLRELTLKHNIPIHMDGARLFNASIAMGVKVKKICENVDSVMFCLSKGLGAPIGSLLCGDKEFINKARDLRKLLGGDMRQAGIIAAPGIYALRHNVERLEKDHSNTKDFVHNLADIEKVRIDQNIQSNIVIMNVEASGLSPQDLCTRMIQKGLYATPISTDEIRFVFSKEISKENVKEAIEIVRQVVEEI